MCDFKGRINEFKVLVKFFVKIFIKEFRNIEGVFSNGLFFVRFLLVI